MIDLRQPLALLANRMIWQEIKASLAQHWALGKKNLRRPMRQLPALRTLCGVNTKWRFGAYVLTPWFVRPHAWQVLDALIGVTMCVLSVLLVRHVVNGL